MRTLYFILSILIISTFANCSKKNEKEKQLDDKITVFFDALEKQDFEEAKKHSTPETQKILVVVEKDAKKYKKHNDKPQDIKIEIIDRVINDNDADYKVKIIIGDKVKEETIHCTLVDEVWLLAVPAEQITIFRFVVFYGLYDEIIVIFKKFEIKKSYKKSHKKSRKKSH